VTGLLVLFVVVMGAGLSAQPLLNARVGAAAGHPVWAALFSVLVSSVTLLAVSQLLRLPAPRVAGILALPPLTLTGGVIGAFVVLAALIAAPRLGAATTVALFIAGQLVMSLVIDHYGLLGVREHALDLKRVLGVLLLVAGVVLIRWA
jgi:transporter family-2 protein